MARVRSMSFPAEVSQLASVRRFTAAVADEFGATVDRDDLAVVIGELAANAAVHVGGAAALTIAAEDDGGLVIEVTDTSSELPRVVHEALTDSEGHRGMVLVEAFSASWGAERTPTGKRVWARLAPSPTDAPISRRSAARPG